MKVGGIGMVKVSTYLMLMNIGDIHIKYSFYRTSFQEKLNNVEPIPKIDYGKNGGCEKHICGLNTSINEVSSRIIEMIDTIIEATDEIINQSNEKGVSRISEIENGMNINILAQRMCNTILNK